MKTEEGCSHEQDGFAICGTPCRGCCCSTRESRLENSRPAGSLCDSQLPLSWVFWCHQFVLPVQAALLLFGEVEAVRAAPILPSGASPLLSAKFL